MDYPEIPPMSDERLQTIKRSLGYFEMTPRDAEEVVGECVAEIERLRASLQEMQFAPKFADKLKEMGFDERLLEEYRNQKMRIRDLEVALQEKELQFTAHAEHVAGFLSELYAVMVDPLEDSGLKVKEVCALLLERAKQDRESLSRIQGLETELKHKGEQ